MLPTPPMISGLPVIGNMVEFLRDKISLIDRGYQEHGEVFAFRLASQNMAMVLGPENAEKVFQMTDKELSMREAFGFLEPVLGQIGILGGFERYMEERKIVAPLLGGRYMTGHAEAMSKEMQLWMEQAGESGSFGINDFSQTITMLVAARALLGDDFRQKLGVEFTHLFHDLANGVDQILPPNLPLPRFKRRDRAKQELDILIGQFIDERRDNPEKHDDFFQKLVDAELPDGSHFDKDRLISLILLIIFAGFDTTSAHLAWGLVYLLEHPDFLKVVMEEIETVFAGTDQLELKHLRDMPHLNYAMMEVERYRPAVQVLIRTVTEDVEIGGYRIPAGWSIMLSPEYSHKMERVFTQPDQFDPERFNDERCEHAQHPNTLTGFGGGLHKCWGMKFAYTEMSIIIATLLHHYDMQLDAKPQEKWLAGMLRPDVNIIYKQREPIAIP